MARERARLVIRPTERLFAVLCVAILLIILGSTHPVLKGYGELVIVAGVLLGLADMGYLAGGPLLKIEWRMPASLPAHRITPIGLDFGCMARNPRWYEIRALAPVECDLYDEWWRGRLAHDGSGSLKFSVQPRKRGVLRIGPVFVSYRSPVGLVKWSGIVWAQQDVTVIPDTAVLRDRLRLAVHEEAGGFSRRLLKLWEEGTVFERLREYQAGDDPRKIDWKATAKRNTLMVREMEHEPDQKVWVVVDAGRVMLGQMGDKSRMDLAVEAGMQVAFASAYLRDRVGWIAFDRQMRVVIPVGAGWSWISHIMRQVYDLEASPHESLYEEASLRILQLAKERAFVVVFSDLLDAVTSRRLIEFVGTLAKRHRVILCVFEDPYLMETADRIPQSADEAVKIVAAMECLREREQVLAHLRQAGVSLVEAPAGHLAVSALNAFLALRKTPV